MRWGTRARAHADAPQSLCSSAEKQIMRRDGLIFISVSLLRVMHAGRPSNTCTSLQSQTQSGLRARSRTVWVSPVKVHLSAQASVQYICARPSAL